MPMETILNSRGSIRAMKTFFKNIKDSIFGC